MVGRVNGLDALINKNPRGKDASVGSVTMAGTIEAIIGAVYLDSSMKSVTEVMQNLGVMPRLVRRTGKKIPVSESEKSSSVTTSNVENQGETEIASKDLDERVAGAMKTSQELDKALREYSIVIQLKERMRDIS